MLFSLSSPRNTTTNAYLRGRFLEYVLDRPDVQSVWKKFTEHEFVLGLGSGSLPVERFKEYLAQDYLYLVRVTSLSSIPC
jgi:thiaminase